MQIHQMIKDTLTNHKKKIEVFQWAVISGVSSLVYSEYLFNIKQKQTPVRMIMVPPIKALNELLHPDGAFMKLLSDQLIDEMNYNKTFKKYSNAPELILFNSDNVELLKTIFDLYVIPNMSRRIPETIAKKFGLNNPQQQLIRESNEIDLFNRKPISGDQFRFIVEQTVLQLLILLPTMKKSVELPEKNTGIYMTDDEILTIGNENAICPIHFNTNIINNESVINLLSFVTNTTIKNVEWQENSLCKRNEIVTREINSGLFNQISITVLEGIDIDNNSDTSI